MKHRTAMVRKGPSVPARRAVRLFPMKGLRVLDYGCGMGRDVELFAGLGAEAVGFDPVTRREEPIGTFDLVVCFYVLNVIESPTERRQVVERCSALRAYNGSVFFAVRSWKDIQSAKGPGWVDTGDGYRTTRGGFQRGYTCRGLQNIMAMGHARVDSVWEEGGTVYAIHSGRR